MKKLLLFLLALCLALGLTSCTNTPPEETAQTTEVITTAQFHPITLYLPNENADGFVRKSAIFDGAPETIISLLVKEGAQPEGCALRSFRGGIADMNAAFGEAISSTGTAGEAMRIGCLVNTLLGFYELESILLRVEGRPAETGHEIYNYPLTFFGNS